MQPKCSCGWCASCLSDNVAVAWLSLAGVCDVCGAVGTHEKWCPNYRKGFRR